MPPRRSRSLIGARVAGALICIVATLAAFASPTPARAAGPTLILESARGRCETEHPAITVRGTGFRPGQAIVLFHTDPKDTKRFGVRHGEGTAAADGTLAIQTQLWGCYRESPQGAQLVIEAYPANAATFNAADALASVTFTVDYTPPPARPGERVCYAETGQCLAGRFLAYWRFNGGLTRYGYPLTGEFAERLEDGKTYTVQYFERVRLEYHPENGVPQDIQVGQFGRRIRPVDPPAPRLYATGQEPLGYDPHYFDATGHNLRGAFRVYFDSNGGLTQFGLPLTEEFVETLEDGKPYTVQYFERARFEYHPENADPRYQVLLGQFGRRILAENGGQR